LKKLTSLNILYRGLCRRELSMSIQKVNCWPIDNQAWMDKTVERQCLYKVDINPGEFFGEIEICNKTCRMEKILAS